MPLHVIEELWEALQSEEEEILDSGGDAEESDIVMAVGSQAPREQVKRKTMRLHGTKSDIVMAVGSQTLSRGC